MAAVSGPQPGGGGGSDAPADLARRQSEYGGGVGRALADGVKGGGRGGGHVEDGPLARLIGFGPAHRDPARPVGGPFDIRPRQRRRFRPPQPGIR